METLSFHHALVLNALGRGVESIGDIVDQCEGMFPLELLDVLNELIEQDYVIRTPTGFSLAAVSNWDVSSQPMGYPCPVTRSIALPQPHPHDFDWRFDPSTTLKLLEIVRQNLPANGHLVLVGAPSLFAALSQLGPAAPQTTLFDWNQSLGEVFAKGTLPPQLRFICLDLLKEALPSDIEPADIVVCDPPWYPEYYQLFLGRVAGLVRLAGIVYVSLFPLNTRPDAAEGRALVLNALAASGLHLRELATGVLKYDTPAFEQVSLSAAGLDRQVAWRRGDLLTLWKVRSTAANAVRANASVVPEMSPETWFEILVEGKKVKLRGPFDDADDYPELISIEPNDVLPTVSRRYHGRSAIDLWFWDNRVFKVRGRTAFRSALRKFGVGNTSDPSPEHISTIHQSRALELLDGLLNQELIGES